MTLLESVLRTRLHHVNVLYSEDGVALPKWSRSRFRSGKEYMGAGVQRGQVYGHVCRVLDSSNVWSQDQAARGLLLLCLGLRESGWSRHLFKNALHRTPRGTYELLGLVNYNDALVTKLC